MMDVSTIVRELAKISREKAVVKSSLLTDAFKAKLVAELDARVAVLQAELSPPAEVVPPKEGKKG